MANIIINACENTSNLDAIKAVNLFICENKAFSGYRYRRDIFLNANRFLRVSEKPPILDEVTCDCSFQVIDFKTKLTNQSKKP